MPGRISCPTLVGREGDLQRVQAHLGGESRALLLIVGDAGIGKSRLLEEALTEARTTGATVLSGACIPLAGRSLPYGPIIDAVRVGTSPDAAPSPLRRELHSLLSSTEDAGLDGDGALAKARILEGVLDRLERAATDEPVVLAIDDLHWSDGATRDLLAFVVPSLWSGRVRLVGTLRADEDYTALKPMMVELDRSGLLDRLDLAPLDDDAVGQVVAGILGGSPDGNLLEAVRGRSGGNPFFVEELVAAAEGGDARLPPNLHEILLARLASLPGSVQGLLRLIAVLGDSVSEPLLAAVSDTDSEALNRGLRAAIDIHVLRTDRHAGTYAFRHALMREVLYADLLAGERRAMHAAVARALEADDVVPLLSPTARSLALAVHWDEAGDLQKAIPALVVGAQAATAAHAHADALDLYRRCLARLEEHPGIAEAIGIELDEVHERAARSAFLADDSQAAIDLASRAVELAGTDDAAREAVLLMHLCEYLWEHGRGTESLAASERAYGMVPDDAEPSARAAVIGFWASSLIVLSRYDEAIPVAEECISLGRLLDDPAVESIGLVTRGAALANLTDVAGGIRDINDGIELARTSNAPDAQLIAYMDGSWTVGIVGGDAERALAIGAEWREVQRQSGLEHVRGMYLAAFDSELLMRLGRWREAEDVLSAALRQPFRGPARHEVVYEAGLLRMRQGQWDEAERLADEALAIAEEMGTMQYVAPTSALAIELALWRGDPGRALALLDDAERRLHLPEDPLYTRHLYAVAVRACVERRDQLRDRRSERESADLLARAEALMGRARYDGIPNLTARLPETRAWSAQAAAELSRADRSPTSADGWRAVAVAWHDLGRSADESYARVREAEAWLSCGDRGRAGAALESARQLAASVGAGSVLAAADAVADRARLRPRSAAGRERASSPLGLTGRELEVLDLVARGLTNRQIAGELFISEKTAGVHVSNILAKLDVSSRAQAAAVAVRHERSPSN